MEARAEHPSTRVALVTTERTKAFAEIEGSPLEGRARISRVDWSDSMDDRNRAALLDEALVDAQALLFAPWINQNIPPFTTERWDRAPDLAVIAGTFDFRFAGWLTISEATRHGVIVVDTSRTMTPTVAEFALAMTLNMLRDIPTGIQLVRDGKWKSGPWEQPGFVYGDLTGRRVGLAGYGSINRRYAELLGPFGCSIMAHDPYVADEEMLESGIEPVESLVALASRSEIFVVGIPPTPTTLGIVDADVIGALPRGALFLLVTRMAVVDQLALWRRSEGGEIRAAVDVFEPEPPPPEASFRTSPFVQPTPHIAGGATFAHRRCFVHAAADALDVVQGRSPRHRATIEDEMLYRGRGRRK